MHSLRTRGTALAVGLIASLAAAGTASASSQNVVPVIKHQDTILKHASVAKSLKNAKINTPAQARREAPKVQRLAATLDRAATAVAHSSADSATQRTGRRDWVAGARKVADGYRQFADALKDIARHDKAAAKSQTTKALKTMLGGAKLIVKAEKLLHLTQGG
jgi:hypothetical protein